jgi:hypothetical protein
MTCGGVKALLAGPDSVAQIATTEVSKRAPKERQREECGATLAEFKRPQTGMSNTDAASRRAHRHRALLLKPVERFREPK